MRLLRVYFSAAVRGASAAPAHRIAQLERLAEVTTRHMANLHTVDLGHSTDQAIFAADQRLLAESDVFIGDFSSPSTGGGFMAARALELGKPGLALFEEAQTPSAMIAGNPAITTARFHDDASFFAAVKRFLERPPVRLRAPRVVLAGPPGSGKGTLGATLSRTWGMPHLSTGELLRDFVKRAPTHPLSLEVTRFMSAGQLVPAETMRELVLTRLRERDCEVFGFLLDGYPPSRADLENLRGVEPDVVFLLELDDATAIARQVQRAARSTDTPEKARTRLEVFKKEPLAPDWFPRATFVRLDATRSADEVARTANDALEGLLGEPRRARSYFPSPPFSKRDVRSTRVHFHIDAKDTFQVRAMARDVLTRHPAAQGQLKVYPIDSLHLGPQHGALGIYPQLPNFHPIAHADAEAFLTGRLGDGDDALMQVVLDVTREHGGMAELEEYVGEWTLLADGSVRVDAKYPPLPSHFDSPHGRCRDIPRLELHLGFDVARLPNGALPLSLAELTQRCTDAGLSNGGWFVFKKDGLAAYRSNEFSNLDLATAEEKLTVQAHALARILRDARLGAEVAFSLELVHGIWTF